MRTPANRQYQDTVINVKLVLSALWITMLFVFVYVDIFGLYRSDVLKAALDGKMATTNFAVNQTFLIYTLAYILLPTLMVVLSLLLKARLNRTINIAVSLLYAVTVAVSCIGETWGYYIAGSVVEVIVLAVIARTAWTWPPPDSAPLPPAEHPDADHALVG